MCEIIVEILKNFILAHNIENTVFDFELTVRGQIFLKKIKQVADANEG
jgi:hypothetical protein